MIYLFNKDEKLIHVLKRNVIVEAIQEEILNELVTLSAVLPLFYYEKELKVNVSKEIEKASFVGHFDQNKDFQLYKIIRVTELNQIEILGIHIVFDELKSSNIIKDRRLTNSTAQNAFTASLEGSRWQVGQVEDLGEKSYTLYYISPLEALSKWREQYSAETRFRLTFDGQKITGRFIDGVKQVGRDTGKRFVHGHNALEVIREQDFSEIYTAVIGRGKGEETLGEDGEPTGGYGRRIGFEAVKWTSPDGLLHKPAGQDYLEFPERTALYGYPGGKPRFRVEVFEEIEDPLTLLSETYNYLLEVSRPMVLFKSSVANIGEVLLGDRVHIIRKELNIHYTTRVQKVERDLLNDRMTVVEIGDYGFFRKDKSKERTEDAINSVEKEVEIVKGATRSRFEQTDERITMEVEKIGGDLDEAKASFIIEASGIRAEVTSLKTYTDAELGKVQEKASSNFDILAGRITAKADYSQVTALGTRVNNVEWDMDAMGGQISQKVSSSDYNGNTIASLINQTATTVEIKASKINLTGSVTVLSELSGDLGNITAGQITGTNFTLSQSGLLDLRLGTILWGTNKPQADYAENAGNANLLNGQYTYRSFSLVGHTHQSNEYVKPYTGQTLFLWRSGNKVRVYMGADYVELTGTVGT